MKVEGRNYDFKILVAKANEAIGIIKKRMRDTGERSGEIECPACGRTLKWSVVGPASHTHGACVRKGCIAWME